MRSESECDGMVLVVPMFTPGTESYRWRQVDIIKWWEMIKPIRNNNTAILLTSLGLARTTGWLKTTTQRGEERMY